MKVVHISYLYGEKNTGGAAIAATRLHKALLAEGVDSYFICTYKEEDGKNVYELPKTVIIRKIRKFVWKVLRVFFGLITHQRSLETNLVPLIGLSKLLDYIKPDVVHVHWINLGSLAFEQLAKIKYPIVLNLHDMFMINAVEPYTGNDVRFLTGFLKQDSSWWERWLFNRKRKAVKVIDPVFVCPSNWMCKYANKSIIGNGCKAYAESNIIGCEFKYQESKSSCDSEFRIVFGANGGSKNKYKGFDDLLKVIEFLPINVRKNSKLCVYGESAKSYIVKGLKVEFYGSLLSRQLVDLLNSCDLFVFPSKEETQGMSKIEAMLCGLPVVTFDRTACAEGIVHLVTGWIAKDQDLQGYANGVEYFFNLHKKGELLSVKREIARYAADKFSTDRITKCLIKIYREVGCVS